MSVQIHQIYDRTKEKYQLTWVGGKEGKNHRISWIYLMEDITIADFIRGDELIITTGLGTKKEDELYQMVQVLIKQKAAGLIVNVGRYIKQIPKSVIALCNQHKFPIFVMPWEIHIVDVSQEYCNWIIKDKQKQVNIAEEFYHLLFKNAKTDLSLMKKMGYEKKGFYASIVVSLPEELKTAETDKQIRYFEDLILKIIGTKIEKYCILIENDTWIFIFGMNQDYLKDIVQELKTIGIKQMGLQESQIGVGSLQEELEQVRKSYQHAWEAYSLSGRQGDKISVYDEIGIYKVLIQMKENEVLEQVYEEYLGRVEAYDKRHNSRYLETLKMYLEQEGSIQAVAKLSFTHRNTINYRMKKIKELLTCDLENQKEKFMLQLCFYIKDILDISENEK